MSSDRTVGRADEDDVCSLDRRMAGSFQMRANILIRRSRLAITEGGHMKKLSIVAIAALSASVCFALPALAQKKSLVVGMGSADAGKLDPHVASTTPDKGLLSWMFNGLVRIRPGKISPEFIEPD